MKKLAKLLWVGLFLMGSVAASAADFSLNPARDFGAIRRINPTDYDGLAVVRETGAGLSSGTSEAFRNALEVFSKAYVQANYVTTSAANASDALLLRLDGSRVMTGNLKFSDNYAILRNTADGSDTGYMSIGGGGTAGAAYGAMAYLYGNEAVGYGGWLGLYAGNVSGGIIQFVTANAERMRITYGGNVLIGTTSDDGANKLQVSGSAKISSLAGTGNRAVYSDANGVLTNSSSDRRMKRLIKTIPDALEKILELRGVYYYWNEANAKHLGTQREIGVIAQEVERIIPEVVRSDSSGMKTVEYAHLVGLLIESTKELNAKVDRQQAEIDELKKLVSKLIKENK